MYTRECWQQAARFRLSKRVNAQRNNTSAHRQTKRPCRQSAVAAIPNQTYILPSAQPTQPPSMPSIRATSRARHLHCQWHYDTSIGPEAHVPSSPEMTSRDRYISVPRLCTVIDSSCIVQPMNVPSGMHPLSAEMSSRWCVHRLRDAESGHCLRHGWLRLATEASIGALYCLALRSATEGTL